MRMTITRLCSCARIMLVAAAVAIVLPVQVMAQQDDNLTLRLLERVEALEENIRDIRRVLEENLQDPSLQGGVASRAQMERMLAIITENEFRILRLEQQIRILAGGGAVDSNTLGTGTLGSGTLGSGNTGSGNLDSGSLDSGSLGTGSGPTGTPAPATPQSSLSTSENREATVDFSNDNNDTAADTGVAVLPDGTPAEQYAFAREKAQQNDWEGAEAAFNAFITANPEDDRLGDAYFWLGRVQFVSGSYEKAVITFREFQTRWPDDPRVEKTLLWIGESVVNFATTDVACDFLGQLPELADNPDESFLARVDQLRTTASCN